MLSGRRLRSNALRMGKVLPRRVERSRRAARRIAAERCTPSTSRLTVPRLRFTIPRTPRGARSRLSGVSAGVAVKTAADARRAASRDVCALKPCRLTVLLQRASIRTSTASAYINDQDAAVGPTDRAYIIYSGESLMEGRLDDIVNNPEVRRLYLGEEFRL